MPSPPVPGRVRFGRFEFDAANADLRKDGRRIRLRPQALTLLTLLVNRTGELVTREELRLALWPEDTFVDFDHGLNATIAAIRLALSDSAARGRLIETVPRRGYRFLGPVTPVEAEHVQRRRTDHEGTAPAAPPAAMIEVAATGPPDAPPGASTTAAPPTQPLQPGPTRWTARAPRTVGLVTAAALLLLAVSSVADRLPWAWAAGTVPAPGVPSGAARRGGTSGVAAWQAYARARVHWANRSDCARAIDDYRVAAAADPAFALPWVGIADCYTIRGEREEAQHAIAEAERRAANLGETHASRGLARMFLSWDWRGARESFDTAMRVSPEYASAYQWGGLLAIFQGRLADARPMLDRAAALDPVSTTIAVDRAWLELASGRPAEALEQCQHARRLSPMHDFNPGCFAAAWLRLGRPDETYGIWAGSAPPPRARATRLLQDYYLAEADRVLAAKPVVHYMIASWYAGAGRNQDAIWHLSKAVAGQEFLVPFAVIEPKFDAIRGEPAFRLLMDQAGLPAGIPPS